jgi:hypothetical protein
MAIGANAVVFSVLNGVILRPLNVPQPESLYLLGRAPAIRTRRNPIPIISISEIAITALMA